MTTPDTVDTSRDSENSIRVYSMYGKNAHNVWDLDSSCIYCGRDRPAGGWQGGPDSDESQRIRVLELKYCKERQQ